MAAPRFCNMYFYVSQIVQLFHPLPKQLRLKKKREKAIPLRQTLAKATKNGPALLTVLRGFRPPPSEQEWPSEGVVTACSKGDVWIYFKWVIRVIPQPCFCSRWRGNCELLQAPKAEVNSLVVFLELQKPNKLLVEGGCTASTSCTTVRAHFCQVIAPVPW